MIMSDGVIALKSQRIQKITSSSFKFARLDLNNDIKSHTRQPISAPFYNELDTGGSMKLGESERHQHNPESR